MYVIRKHRYQVILPSNPAEVKKKTATKKTTKKTRKR